MIRAYAADDAPVWRHHASRAGTGSRTGSGPHSQLQREEVLMAVPPTDDVSANDDAAILDALRTWLERDVRPRVLELEHGDVYPTAMVEQMKAFGLFGATIAPAYGGLGLPASTYARIVALISEVWIALPGAFNTHLIMAALVERFGTEAQKRAFLPRFATGGLRGGLALTEADGGTDLQAIRARAVRDGDHYVINGAKTWITNGIEGSCFALLVKTDPAAEPRHRGMSLFLAEKGPGFRVGRKLEKLGYHGSDTAELFFEDYRVPAGRLIGGAEGRGFAQVMVGLEFGRINVAARSVGLANAALKDSVRYAQVRRTFGKPIGEHQAIQLKLAEMATRCEAARLLTESAAAAYDRGERCDVEAAMAKYFASEAALANAEEALRIHGAAGYSKDLPIERYYRDAPLLCIGEGTNELQRIIIARQLLARNPV
jgi:alkylation response protein AidB-like acyl-CoA dehydrogenase